MTTKLFFNKVRGLTFKSLSPYIVGISTGDATLKVIGMRTLQKPTLSFYSILKMPRVSDDGYLAEAIQRVLKDNRFTEKDTVILFDDETVAIRRTELPKVASREILDALRWQAVDMVHFDISKAALDFKILREAQKEDGSRSMDLLFVAASQEAIDKKVRAVKGAGLQVISVSVPAFGVEKILRLHEGIDPAKTVMAVDFGYSRMEIAVFRNKSLEFVRSIQVGSRNITNAIKSGFIPGSERISFTEEEADKVKEEIGIAYEPVTLPGGISSNQIVSLMRPTLEWISKELKRSIDYYNQEYAGSPIVEAYLIGGGSRLKNLDRYLTEVLDIPVKKMTVPKVIEASKAGLKNDDELAILPLMGLALGYENQLNLLPHEYKAEKIELVEKVSLRIITFAVTVILLVSSLFIKLRVDNYVNRLKNVKAQNAILSQVKYVQDRVAERSALMAQAQKLEIPPEYIMKELSNIIPGDVILERLEVDERNKTMDFRGIVYEPRGVAESVLTKFMEELEKSWYFRDAQLVSVQGGSEAGKEDRCTFEISCSLE